MNRTQVYYQRVTTALAGYLAQELNIRPNHGYYLKEAINGPRIITLLVVINPRYTSRIAGMAQALSQAAGLNKDQSIRIARGRGGALSIEIPKPGSINSDGTANGLWYNVSIQSLPRRHGLKATIGLDIEHRPTLVNFDDPLTPHILVAGTTGSGKTCAGRLLAYDLANQNSPNEVQFIFIDTRKRGIGWRPFANLPHLAHPIITDDQTALKALAWTVAEIDRRSANGRTSPRIFVGIDEAQAILDQDSFTKPIMDITAVGREFGIHLLAAMQNPTAKQLRDVSIKRNLTTRLVGKMDSASSAVVAAGIGETGAERLTGAGDFLLIQPGETRRLTTALLTDRDTDLLPRTEMVGYLDLEEYEDIAHVLSQADNQSKADPVDPAQVAWAMVNPETSQRAMYDEFHIGFPKVKRTQDFAEKVLAELHNLGHTLCRLNYGTNGNIPLT